MQNLIKVVYPVVAATVTFDVVYDNNGTMTARESDTAMTNEPVGSIIYKGSPTKLVAGDIVIIKVDGVPLDGQEYHINVALETTVADDNPDGSSTDVTFTMADGPTDVSLNGIYNNMIASVTDVSGGVVASRRIIGYTAATRKIEVDEAFKFPLAIGDQVKIWSDTYSQTAAASVIGDIATAVWSRQQSLSRDVGTTGRKQSDIRGGIY